MNEQRNTADSSSSAVESNAIAPAGYCPHCNYRIDPGLCPECGQIVDQDQLQLQPRRRRLRKWLKRCVALAIAINLILIGRWVYQSECWKRWAPTSYLTARQPADDWTHDELLRRFKAGELSANEIADFFDAAYPLELKLKSPHPLTIAPTLTLVRKCGPYAYNMSPYATRASQPATVSVNGEVVDCCAFGGMAGPLFGSSSSSPKVLKQMPLGVGLHEIEVTSSVTYDVKSRRDGPSLPGFPIRRSLTLTKSLEIVDRPLGSFVNGQFNNELAQTVSNSIRLVLSRRTDEGVLRIHVHCGKPPINVDGWLLIRNTGSETLFGKCRLTIPKVGASDRYLFETTLPDTVTLDELVLDVEFVPDLEIALVSAGNSYFSGRMTWRDVHVIVQVPAELEYQPSDSAVESPIFARSPDSVTEWRPN